MRWSRILHQASSGEKRDYTKQGLRDDNSLQIAECKEPQAVSMVPDRPCGFWRMSLYLEDIDRGRMLIEFVRRHGCESALNFRWSQRSDAGENK